MKFRTLLIVGFALILSACAEKDKATPAGEDDAQTSAGAAMPEPSATEKSIEASDAVIRHMHLHARQLSRLNGALARADLVAAQTPAYWLSRHEGMSIFPDGWQPHMKKMRLAAQGVEAATDLGAARAAAVRIADSCRGCHTAAGFDVDITRTEFD